MDTIILIVLIIVGAWMNSKLTYKGPKGGNK